MARGFPKGYPANAGGKVVGPYFISGPNPYAPGVGQQLKIASLRSIDYVGEVMSVSGTYFVRCKPSALGTPNSWNLLWYVSATGAEAGALNLSAESVQVLVVGG